ncbi:MAG: hypothetical protein ACOCXI_08290 [Chloroflexota bacterium]
MIILVRIVAALMSRFLSLFPPNYRRQYQEERACVLRLALEERAAHGYLPLLLFCARELRDLPAAIWRAHWREWRQKMNRNQESETSIENGLRGWHLLWFVFPFLVTIMIPLAGLVGPGLWIPSVPLLVITIVVAVAGFTRGVPRWALPSLGLAIGLANLLIMQTTFMRAEGSDLLGRLKAVLWTDVMAERVLYALIANAIYLAPAVLILLLLALVASTLPGLPVLRDQLAEAWTVLPFLLYTTSLLTPFLTTDVYQGLARYQLLFLLLLVTGAWFYLRASRPALQMAALLVATLLCGAALSLGIYLVYPQQSWIYRAGAFPRWWETLMPVLESAVRLVALVLLAVAARWHVARFQHTELATTEV